MSEENAVAVLVIGGGPVGLALSCELARYGISFRCVDKRAAPVTHSHASVVHVRTQEFFHAMGCAQGFVREGHLFAEQQFFAFGKRLGQTHLNGVDSPFDGPRDIWQSVTERLLIEHLATFGKQVQRSVEATDYREDTDHAFVTLRHPDGRTEVVRATWVVAAEGSHSIVRQALGIPFEGARYEGQEFIQTDAHVRFSYQSGIGHAFIEKDRFVGFFPFDSNGFYRVLCARPDRDPSNHQPPTLDELQQIVRESVDPDAVLSEPAWLNRFRTQRKIAQVFHKGRAFLAGDSGHVHVPVGGQGMNTGIQDAFNLAWKLAYVLRGWARPELLQTYHEERHPVAQNLLKFTDTGFNTLAHPDTLHATLIGMLGGFLLGLRPVQEAIRRTLEEMGIGYFRSRLSLPGGGSLRPGSRAPTATIVRSEGMQTASLLDVLKGERWTLLAFDASAGRAAGLAQQAAKATQRFLNQVTTRLVLRDRPAGGWPSDVPFVVDRGGDLHAKYDAREPRFALIRPDWYVATTVAADRVDLIGGYFSDWLIAQS